MADRRPEPLDLVAGGAMALVVGLSVWVRWPGFVQGGFASHDVAGILYNAMVLERGGLPYVDTLELKAPGTFYLAQLLAGPEGRDIAVFQVWANVWALLSLTCVAAIGWRTWGRWAGVVAASIYALHDANLDSMDANYVTWANLPQILAMGLCLEGARARERACTGWWIAAGAMCGAAGLLKQQDGVVVVVVLACALWPPGASRAGWRAGLCVLLGVAGSQLPIAVHYAAHGQLDALVTGFVFNPWGLRYVAEIPPGGALQEGLLAATFFLALGLALASLAIARASPTAWRGPLRWILAWALVTLAAAAIGARFYKGYFLASAAPLALLAAAPWSLLGHWPLRPGWLRALLLVPVAVLVVRAGFQLSDTRADRARSHDAGARTIAAHIAENTTPEDTIWVWGWHLWDVYPLAGRMSGSRIYKSLGVLTPPNDDTWRRPASPQTFVDGEHGRMLIGDLQRARPRYVVLGSTVPHHEFVALRDLLRRDYRRDRRVRVGRVELWRLRDPPVQGAR